MIGLRRKARIIALQTLYEIDCSAHKPQEVLAHNLQGKDIPEEVIRFAQELITGVLQNSKTIDSAIKQFAPLFPLEQIATIDRNILRLAIFEVLFDSKVPIKAAINESVELAKSFGSDASPKFVNGVLGSIIAERVTLSK